MLNPFGAPLPPVLARLFALLEAHTEATEEGVLIIEQDRRPVRGGEPGGPPLDPVIVFVPAAPRAGATSGRVAPDLIAELVTDGGPGRAARYARAGVREYWRVEAAPPRIVVHTEPAGDAFGRVEAFAGDDPVRSPALPGLSLRPRDLVP
jgi:hypothetical protein